MLREHHRSPRVLALAFLVSASLVSPAVAQQPITDVLTFLVTNQAVLTGDPARDAQAAAATRDAISRSLLASLASLPISSSSSGFTYRLNPALGTIERTSQTFGPFFVERALTAGQGHGSFGVTFQTASFDRLDGRSLTDGTLVTTSNAFPDEKAPFDIDTLTLRLRASTVTFVGSVGLTDRLDVGVAVPLVSLSMDGARINTYRGTVFQQATASATVTGLADIALRTKYQVVHAPTFGLAAAVDVRLPTGHQEDLLGAGKTAVRILGVVSTEQGRWALHGNAGVSRGGLSNEIDYGAAASFAATGRLTINAEVFGRRFTDLGQLVDQTAANAILAGVETTRLGLDQSAVMLTSGVAGIKWNVAGRWLLDAHVLLSPGQAGLHARVVPIIALERSVGR